MRLSIALARIAFALPLSLLATAASAQSTGSCNPSNTIAGFQFTDFVSPDAMTAPFESWSRGDAGSTYVAWSEFASPFGGTNLPYVCPITPLPTTFTLPDGGSATVEQLTPPVEVEPGEFRGAFITSGGNIYSFAVPVAFDAVVDGRSTESPFGYDTRIVAQVGTLGTVADPASYLLTLEGPDGQSASLAPDSVTLLATGSSGSSFGGVREVNLLQWDLLGFVPDGYTISFEAFGSSMSLDTLTIDAFSQMSAVAGDFDRNRVVDGADYTAWSVRYGVGDLDSLAADANGDGVIDAADYTLWRDASASPAALAIPEPGGATMAAGGLLTVSFCLGVHCFTARREPRE